MLKESDKVSQSTNKSGSGSGSGTGVGAGGYGSGTGRFGNGAGSYGNGFGVDGGDGDFLSAQIYPHWVVPAGVKNAENLNIELQMQIGDNGEVIASSLKVVDSARYASDSLFRAAADSAKRAVLAASPLQIPADKISIFKNNKIKVKFNVKEALGD